jgi:hypothetical protein
MDSTTELTAVRGLGQIDLQTFGTNSLSTPRKAKISTLVDSIHVVNPRTEAGRQEARTIVPHFSSVPMAKSG